MERGVGEQPVEIARSAGGERGAGDVDASRLVGEDLELGDRGPSPLAA
jgi:hypothetical protein